MPDLPVQRRKPRKGLGRNLDQPLQEEDLILRHAAEQWPKELEKFRITVFPRSFFGPMKLLAAGGLGVVFSSSLSTTGLYNKEVLVDNFGTPCSRRKRTRSLTFVCLCLCLCVPACIWWYYLISSAVNRIGFTKEKNYKNSLLKLCHDRTSLLLCTHKYEWLLFSHCWWLCTLRTLCSLWIFNRRSRAENLEKDRENMEVVLKTCLDPKDWDDEVRKIMWLLRLAL